MFPFESICRCLPNTSKASLKCLWTGGCICVHAHIPITLWSKVKLHCHRHLWQYTIFLWYCNWHKFKDIIIFVIKGDFIVKGVIFLSVNDHTFDWSSFVTENLNSINMKKYFWALPAKNWSREEKLCSLQKKHSCFYILCLNQTNLCKQWCRFIHRRKYTEIIYVAIVIKFTLECFDHFLIHSKDIIL